MLKKAIFYFLYTCILLLGAYGQLSAHPNKQTDRPSYIVHFERLKLDKAKAICSGIFALVENQKPYLELEEFLFENEENNNNEDEFVSFKKYLDRNASLVMAFFSKACELVDIFDKNRIFSDKVFSYTPSFRCVVLQVFKI